jgi:chemotaxis protein MotB
MRISNKKTIALLTCLAALTLMSGCVNWEKRYKALSVEHENLKGLLERERSEKGTLVDRISQDQMTIEEYERKIEELAKSPGEVTGFGDFDVTLDPTKGTITVTLPNAILFDSGKAVLKRATSSELDQIYSVLRDKYASKDIDVVGHTDTDPIRKSKWKDNWELSAQRALSVLRYLVKKGISPEKIKASGRGQSQPIASNSSSSGKARNRRVEIVVHMR